MRYNLDSELPINAFSPRGGRSPFARGMTLEGGGGGFIGKALGSVAKGVTGVVKGVVQPVYDATLKNIPGVDNALVGLDKAVGKTIPGGWGTVASVASTFIPGGAFAANGLLSGITQTQLATGLGALSGSGVMRGKHEFNLQGAIMGGAMAYGASTLSAGLQEAGNVGTPTDQLVKANIGDTTSALSGTGSAPVSGASTFTPTANALQNASADFSALPNAPTAAQSFTPPSGSDFGLKNLASNPTVPSGDFGLNPAATVPSGLGSSAPVGMLDKVANSISNIPGAIADKATSAFDTLTSPETYSNLGTNLKEAGSGTLSNMADAGAGIKNLVTGAASLPASVSLTNTAVPMLFGATGLAALDEQQKYLDSQLAAGAIGQAEYSTAKAKIDSQVEIAKKVVADNPLKVSADTTSIKDEPTTYAKNNSFNNLYNKSPEKMYAEGGNVQVNPPDDQTGIPSRTPMTNFDQPGIMSMIGNTVPPQMYAAGGMPRFLSGGGDGMSDSIKASINGSQEARLADGEFVIPADVVSHIGNGSSKAGAKQLYSMMDRVRQARVGTKKQGKQINPRKFLAA